jgi:hypothetical protein
MSTWRIGLWLVMSLAACGEDQASAESTETPGSDAAVDPGASADGGGADAGLVAPPADAAPTPDAQPGEVDAARRPPTRLSVLDQLGFAREVTPGVAPGFNLDERVSDGRDELTCFKRDYTSPEGEPGIDNQLAGLVPLLDAFGLGAVEGLVQGSIEEGGLLIVWELDGLDDLVEDDEVRLRYRLGRGTPLLGTDGLLLSGQTFHVHPDSLDLVVPNARVSDGVLTAGPFDARLPIVVFGVKYELPIQGTYLRARLTYDGGLEDGLLGGGVRVEDVLAIAVTANMNAGGVLDAVTAVLNGRGDMDRDETGACKTISGAFAFSSVSAYFYQE